MRVILDTNILVSALLAASGTPDFIYHSWLEGVFTLIIAEAQIAELRKTFTKPYLARQINPQRVGRLINQLRELAEFIDTLPYVRRSVDTDDDYLLAMAEAGRADYLVTGDKGHLLALVRHAGTRIISARDFADLLP